MSDQRNRDMKIVAVLRGRLIPDAGPDDQDTLAEAKVVGSTLTGIGYRPVRIEVGLDTSKVERKLKELRPVLAFNLVDAIDGDEELVTVAPEMLERIGVPYSGTSAHSLRLASNKLKAKVILGEAGIPTPAAVPWRNGMLTFSGFPDVAGGYIIKPVSGSASDGIDDDSVLRDRRDVKRINSKRLGELDRGTAFIEQFIEGREFAVSLIEGPAGAQVLPPTEILFQGFSFGKPKIVSYAAKWISDSFEYRSTTRRFYFPAKDAPVLSRLCDLAVRCWNAFGLGGYARIDFRVDINGGPRVVDINPNPCLSLDAGFMASAAKAGLTMTNVVERIISYPSGRRREQSDNVAARGIPV